MRRAQYARAVRLGLNLGYWGAGNDADNLVLAREADHLGYSVVWAAEAYGSDAATVLARTLYAQAMDVSVNAATFIQVNSTIVSTWLNCLTVNAHCPLFAAFVPSAVTSAFANLQRSGCQ